MTKILMKVLRPEQSGRVPWSGKLRWEPTRRIVDGDFVVRPEPFDVLLVNGEGTAEVHANGLGWCWKVAECPVTPGKNLVSYSEPRYFIIPDRPEVLYADLVQVDPATLEPTAAPVAAWWEALAQAQIGIYATAVPGNPELVKIHYPVWSTLPGHPNILIMPIQEAQP